jgi:single-stranded-DNA-specific exonuclease
MRKPLSQVKWVMRSATANVNSQDCLKDLGISSLMASILRTRRLKNLQEIQSYWSPRLEGLYEAEIMKDMVKASERLARAVREGQKIVIWGDYDVDGATSVALLMRFFTFVGAQIDFHIPNRLTDGYGLNEKGLETIKTEGASVVVTVDNGISANMQADFARKLNLDLIITDHHEVPEKLPEAFAIVDPKQKDCSYPNKAIAGVGVAFKLACATAHALARGRQLSPDMKRFLLESLALVAIGTIADLVSLVGENRILVGYGLQQINISTWPGLRALIEVSACSQEVTSSDIAFKLAPRINAAGRLATAELGVRLLTCEDSQKASQYAQEMDRSNTERRLIEKEHFHLALNSVGELPLTDRALVVSGEAWHPGVIGIVASRLVEEFTLPVVVIAFEGDRGKASCRSLGDFNMHEALSRLSDLLETYGGHAMAAGFTICRKNLEAFTFRFHEIAREHFIEHPQRELIIDSWAPLASINESFLNEMGRLAPFGSENPRPLIAVRQVHLTNIRRLGRDGSHLSFNTVSPNTSLRSIFFQAGEMMSELKQDKSWDLAFQPRWNFWRGQRQIELDIKGMRPAAQEVKQ